MAPAVPVAVPPPPEPLPFPPGSPIMTGSGIVLEGGRRIVTNRHVVDGQREIAVRNGTGHVRMARVVRTAADDDLALLEIDTPFPDAPAFPLAGVADPAPGRAAVVLGYPLIGILGDEQPALTEGIVAKTVGLATSQHAPDHRQGQPEQFRRPAFDRQGPLIGSPWARWTAPTSPPRAARRPRTSTSPSRPGVCWPSWKPRQ